MQYLCLVYQRDDAMSAYDPVACEALMSETFAYTEELRQSGHFVAVSVLEPIDSAMSLRVRGNSAYITDGAYVKAQEHVTGYLLIEARDLNEAVRIATRFPPGRLGGMEVRPVMNLPQPSIPVPTDALSAAMSPSPTLER